MHATVALNIQVFLTLLFLDVSISGGSRGGVRGTALLPLFWAKKRRNDKWEKSQLRKSIRTANSLPPPLLAQGLDPPLSVLVVCDVRAESSYVQGI